MFHRCSVTRGNDEGMNNIFSLNYIQIEMLVVNDELDRPLERERNPCVSVRIRCTVFVSRSGDAHCRSQGSDKIMGAWINHL